MNAIQLSEIVNAAIWGYIGLVIVLGAVFVASHSYPISGNIQPSTSTSKYLPPVPARQQVESSITQIEPSITQVESHPAKNTKNITVKELKKIAKEKGIKGYSRMQKSQLISSIAAN